MYFGFELMWTLTFVPVGFAIVTAASVAFGCVYFVGASKGGAAAMRYTRVVAIAFAAGIVADLVFGVATGHLARFLEWYGSGPLFEMAILAFMWVATMWLMASSYSRGKSREDEGSVRA